MGVTGLHNFLKSTTLSGIFTRHTMNDILDDIRRYKAKHGKNPKVLINVRAFNNCFDKALYDINYGCRFNIIKNEFETLLEALKSAGADLIFLARKRHLSLKEGIALDSYKYGMQMMHQLAVNRYKFSDLHPWKEISVLLLIQSAMKFGTFKAVDSFIVKQTANHVKIANEEEVYAIIGLDTNYLFYEGDWKFFFPAKDVTTWRSNSLIFIEYNKQNVMDHFGLSFEQLRLFGVLSAKFGNRDDIENSKKLRNYFAQYSRIGHWSTDFTKIIDFVHRYAPVEKFPLQNETIDEILTEIFGDSELEKLRIWFKNEIEFKTLPLDEYGVRYHDEEVNAILAANPLSTLAEAVLNVFPCMIASPFLSIYETDVMPLKDLTKGWFKRFSGILLKHAEIPKSFVVTYHVGDEKFENLEVHPESPEFDIPKLKNLIAGEMDSAMKLKLLSFLIRDIISEDELKKIPNEHLMHVIIVTHMYKNGSISLQMVRALTLAIMESDKLKIDFPYPTHVNVRAFRVGVIYEELFGILLMMLSAMGMTDFISELKLDNVRFQKIYKDILSWTRGNGSSNINIPHYVHTLIYKEA